jgi:hypothetical protein
MQVLRVIMDEGFITQKALESRPGKLKSKVQAQA